MCVTFGVIELGWGKDDNVHVSNQVVTESYGNKVFHKRTC